MPSEDLKRDLLDLGVEVNGVSPDMLRDTLVRRLATLHPDKTGGAFLNEQQESAFRKIKILLERLDLEASVSTQLIPINQVVTLVDALSKLQTSNAPIAEIRNVAVVDRYKRDLRRRYALPKITSAAIAAACFALFSLLGSFRQNPLYRSAVDFYVQDSKANILEWTTQQTKSVSRDWITLYNLAEEARYTLSLTNKRPERLRNAKTSDEILSEFYRSLGEDPTADQIERLVEKNNVIDINLYDPAEPEFLSHIKTSHSELAKNVSSSITKLDSTNPKSEYDREFKAAMSNVFYRLQRGSSSLDAGIKSLETQLAKQKMRALSQADGRILRRLALLTMTACLAFVLLWLRERSDERWVDFLSTEEGVQVMLERLSANRNIMERQPPGFSLNEFTRIVGSKDVPALLSPIVGSRLDTKRLGQISSFLLEQLKNKGVISSRTTATLQTWFDVRVPNGASLDSQETSTNDG